MSDLQRSYDRAPADPRPISFERGFLDHVPGSVIASFGKTRVLCTAVVNEGVPPFLKGKGQGWLTAEYSMLPASTNTRKPRDRAGKTDGRSVEIQRLIGRSLRAVVDLDLLGERTLWVDCDVLQADGGTRTTAISGAWVAMHDLLAQMDDQRKLRAWPLKTHLGAISVGVVEDQVVCDLDYKEDSRAQVDFNVVMTGDGEFVEVQGTGEEGTFSRTQLEGLLESAEGGIRRIFEAQKEALGLP
jgi:ribonuclease PH